MTKHKHYYCIRAYADGWKVEYKNYLNTWCLALNPVFEGNREYRVVPDENGWLPWYGGECPVDPDTMVEGRYKGGPVIGVAQAHSICWEHTDKAGDVIAYRIIKEAEADPYAELKAAAKNPNKEIAIRGHEVTLGWHSGKYWKFDYPVENYVVRDKPKVKKIKLLAWLGLDQLHWYTEEETKSLPKSWKRVPSEDKEIEVEE